MSVRVHRLAAACAAAALCLGLYACKKKEAPPEPKAAATQPAQPIKPADAPKPAIAAQPTKPQYSRKTLNSLAVRANLPLFWSEDKNKNGKPDADEVYSLLFYPTAGRWVEGGQLTPAFHAAVQSLAAAELEPTGTPEEVTRRKLVREDLDQGLATLVHSDLRALTPPEKAFVRKLMEVSELIDALYGRLNGSVALRAQVPADDAASQSLLRRNWSSRCKGPKTEKNPACSAIPGAPAPVFDLYPAALQKDNKFCATLEKHPDTKALMAPFVAVREEAGKLVAVPYTKAYPAEMGGIAAKLREAAALLPQPAEAALKAYLEAAAQAFGDNGWEAADEKWAAMNAHNSKWYVRVGPDETYWEPCSQKAGFHVTFARINPDSLAWQAKLQPVQQEMEDNLAKLIGEAYKARKATFHLPDFVDIVWNAGDDRQAFGGTIGQSLPNWGKVANESRGRTVAMSNLYQDPSSLGLRKQGAQSLIAAQSMAPYSDAKTPGLLNTILHEATHNLGPSHEFAVGGKGASQVFGGGMASMLEELKAQCGALWYLDFLARKGVITAEMAKQTYLDGVVWAFGHIARGMYDARGGRKAYSQLAAIQMGFFLEEGVLTFDKDATAMNGTDKGAFLLNYDKFPAAAEKLMKKVGAIKATGDKTGAEELAKRYVDGAVVPQAVITERILRSPRMSFVYSLDM